MFRDKYNLSKVLSFFRIKLVSIKMSQQQLSTKKVMNLSGAVVHEFSVNFNLILPEMSENIELQ